MMDASGRRRRSLDQAFFSCPLTLFASAMSSPPPAVEALPQDNSPRETCDNKVTLNSVVSSKAIPQGSLSFVPPFHHELSHTFSSNHHSDDNDNEDEDEDATMVSSHSLATKSGLHRMYKSSSSSTNPMTNNSSGSSFSPSVQSSQSKTTPNVFHSVPHGRLEPSSPSFLAREEEEDDDDNDDDVSLANFPKVDWSESTTTFTVVPDQFMASTHSSSQHLAAPSLPPPPPLLLSPVKSADCGTMIPLSPRPLSKSAGFLLQSPRSYTRPRRVALSSSSHSPSIWLSPSSSSTSTCFSMQGVARKHPSILAASSHTTPTTTTTAPTTTLRRRSSATATILSVRSSPMMLEHTLASSSPGVTSMRSLRHNSSHASVTTRTMTKRSNHGAAGDSRCQILDHNQHHNAVPRQRSSSSSPVSTDATVQESQSSSSSSSSSRSLTSSKRTEKDATTTAGVKKHILVKIKNRQQQLLGGKNNSFHGAVDHVVVKCKSRRRNSDTVSSSGGTTTTRTTTHRSSSLTSSSRRRSSSSKARHSLTTAPSSKESVQTTRRTAQPIDPNELEDESLHFLDVFEPDDDNPEDDNSHDDDHSNQQDGNASFAAKESRRQVRRTSADGKAVDITTRRASKGQEDSDLSRLAKGSSHALKRYSLGVSSHPDPPVRKSSKSSCPTTDCRSLSRQSRISSKSDAVTRARNSGSTAKETAVPERPTVHKSSSVKTLSTTHHVENKLQLNQRRQRGCSEPPQRSSRAHRRLSLSSVCSTTKPQANRRRSSIRSRKASKSAEGQCKADRNKKNRSDNKNSSWTRTNHSSSQEIMDSSKVSLHDFLNAASPDRRQQRTGSTSRRRLSNHSRSQSRRLLAEAIEKIELDKEQEQEEQNEKREETIFHSPARTEKQPFGSAVSSSPSPSSSSSPIITPEGMGCSKRSGTASSSTTTTSLGSHHSVRGRRSLTYHMTLSENREHRRSRSIRGSRTTPPPPALAAAAATSTTAETDLLSKGSSQHGALGVALSSLSPPSSSSPGSIPPAAKLVVF